MDIGLGENGRTAVSDVAVDAIRLTHDLPRGVGCVMEILKGCGVRYEVGMLIEIFHSQQFIPSRALHQGERGIAHLKVYGSAAFPVAWSKRGVRPKPFRKLIMDFGALRVGEYRHLRIERRKASNPLRGALKNFGGQ